jgi:hypothetical protein
LRHIFEEQGAFTIKAKAKDEQNAEGDWGYLVVEMPMSLLRFLRLAPLFV